MAVARLLLLLAASAPALGSPALSECTGFECILAYVARPDKSFAWRSMGKERQGNGWSYQVFNMTSQQWFAHGEGYPSVWWHFFVLITPKGAVPQPEGWANLVIGEGSTLTRVLPESNQHLSAGIELAVRTGAPTGVLIQVPNEPTVFSEDSHRAHKFEDAMRAFGWKMVMANPSAYHYAMEVPNVKAIVRALDMLAELKKSSRFLVTGFSKRGLAVWLSAAADKRVRAIMPGCHDLNLEALVRLERRNYAAVPFAAKDYFDEKVPDIFTSPGGKALVTMIDPHYFQSRLEGVEKYVMAVTNDDFFPLDQSSNWWGNTSLPRMFNMLPNHRHLLQMHEDDLLPGAIAFAQGVLHDKPRPRIGWSSENGVIRAWQEGGAHGLRPTSVKLFSGTTCERSGLRDFRKLTHYKGLECLKCGMPFDLFSVGACLMRSSRFDFLELDTSASEWVAEVEAPEHGWRAGFLQFEYDGPFGDARWMMTTGVTVMPDTHPFDLCTGSGCPDDKLLKTPGS